MRIILIVASLLLLHACKHPLSIEGKGDIVELLNGERGCTLEEFEQSSPRCADNEVVGEAYVVSYEPVPREGWEFAAWEGLACAPNATGDLCNFALSEEFINNWNEAVPGFVTAPTTAVFRPLSSEVINYYQAEVSQSVMEGYCLGCHTEAGAAANSRLLFSDAASDRKDIDNITAFGRFLDTVSEGRGYILDTVGTPANHGGVTTLAEDSAEYAALRSFLRSLEAEGLYDDGSDGVFTKDFGDVNNWAGRRTISFPYYGTGSGETVTVRIKNNRNADPGPTGWQLAWSEEFNEPAGTQPNPDIWTPEIGDGTNNGIPGWGNDELQYYTGDADNASTDGEGNMAITVREADGSLDCYYGTCRYTSARLITNTKVDFAYGRIETRMKVAEGSGLWPAFWTLGTDIAQVGWPRCGEIDIMEFVGREPNEVFGTIHGPGYSAGQSFGDDYFFEEPVYNDFHTFAIEWEVDEIRWYVDDILYHQATPADLSPREWVFNKENFLILNMAIGGNFGGPVDPDIQLPASTLVDYIRVFGPADDAERYELTFKDDTPGWRQVELSLEDLVRSKEQPDGAPDDGYSWSTVWGYDFILPRGGSVTLNDVEVSF